MVDHPADDKECKLSENLAMSCVMIAAAPFGLEGHKRRNYSNRIIWGKYYEILSEVLNPLLLWSY